MVSIQNDASNLSAKQSVRWGEPSIFTEDEIEIDDNDSFNSEDIGVNIANDFENQLEEKTINDLLLMLNDVEVEKNEVTSESESESEMSRKKIGLEISSRTRPPLSPLTNFEFQETGDRPIREYPYKSQQKNIDIRRRKDRVAAIGLDHLKCVDRDEMVVPKTKKKDEAMNEGFNHSSSEELSGDTDTTSTKSTSEESYDSMSEERNNAYASLPGRTRTQENQLSNSDSFFENKREFLNHATENGLKNRTQMTTPRQSNSVHQFFNADDRSTPAGRDSKSSSSSSQMTPRDSSDNYHYTSSHEDSSENEIQRSSSRQSRNSRLSRRHFERHDKQEDIRPRSSRMTPNKREEMMTKKCQEKMLRNSQKENTITRIENGSPPRTPSSSSDNDVAENALSVGHSTSKQSCRHATMAINGETVNGTQSEIRKQMPKYSSHDDDDYADPHQEVFNKDQRSLYEQRNEVALSRQEDNRQTKNNDGDDEIEWSAVSVKVAAIVLKVCGNKAVAQEAASAVLFHGYHQRKKGSRNKSALKRVAADVSNAILDLGGGDVAAKAASKTILSYIIRHHDSISLNSSSSSTSTTSYTNIEKSENTKQVIETRGGYEMKQIEEQIEQEQNKVDFLEKEQLRLEEKEQEWKARDILSKRAEEEASLVKSLARVEAEKEELKRKMAQLIRSGKENTSLTLSEDESLQNREIVFHQRLAKATEMKKKMLTKLKKLKYDESDHKKKYAELVKKRKLAESAKGTYEKRLNKLKAKQEKIRHADRIEKRKLMDKVQAAKENKLTLNERKKYAKEDEMRSKMLESELLHTIAEAEADTAKYSEELKALGALIDKKERTAHSAENKSFRTYEEIVNKLRKGEEEKMNFSNKVQEIQESLAARRYDDEKLMQMMVTTENERAVLAKKMSKLQEAENMLKKNEEELYKRMAAAQTDLLIKRMNATADRKDMSNHQEYPGLKGNADGQNEMNTDVGPKGILRNPVPAHLHKMNHVRFGNRTVDYDSIDSGSFDSEGSVTETEQKDFFKSLQNSIKETGNNIFNTFSQFYTQASCGNPKTIYHTKTAADDMSELSPNDDEKQRENDLELENILGVNNPYLTDADFEDLTHYDEHEEPEMGPALNTERKLKLPPIYEEKNVDLRGGNTSMLSRADDDVDGLIADVDDLLYEDEEEQQQVPNSPSKSLLSKISPAKITEHTAGYFRSGGGTTTSDINHHHNRSGTPKLSQLSNLLSSPFSNNKTPSLAMTTKSSKQQRGSFVDDHEEDYDIEDVDDDLTKVTLNSNHPPNSSTPQVASSSKIKFFDVSASAQESMISPTEETRGTGFQSRDDDEDDDYVTSDQRGGVDDDDSLSRTLTRNDSSQDLSIRPLNGVAVPAKTKLINMGKKWKFPWKIRRKNRR